MIMKKPPRLGTKVAKPPAEILQMIQNVHPKPEKKAASTAMVAAGRPVKQLQEERIRVQAVAGICQRS